MMRSLVLLIILWPSVPTSAEELLDRVVGIADADTLTLLVEREQTRIRRAQIDTPERGQPWARRARQALSDKVFRKDVRVEVVDVDRYGRAVGGSGIATSTARWWLRAMPGLFGGI